MVPFFPLMRRPPSPERPPYRIRVLLSTPFQGVILQNETTQTIWQCSKSGCCRSGYSLQTRLSGIKRNGEIFVFTRTITVTSCRREFQESWPWTNQIGWKCDRCWWRWQSVLAWCRDELNRRLLVWLVTASRTTRPLAGKTPSRIPRRRLRGTHPPAPSCRMNPRSSALGVGGGSTRCGVWNWPLVCVPSSPVVACAEDSGPVAARVASPWVPFRWDPMAGTPGLR